MPAVDTVVIGAGQAGLAMSRCLGDRGRDHIVLERGRLAERWRSERWDSMRLLSPNWMTRLPGWSYTGPDPDGFMTAGELVAHFEGYATASAAPVEEHTTVRSVRPADGGFCVDTDRGRWSADHVVIATGWNDRPAVPSMAAALDPATFQITPADYRNPSSLPAGGVLVVGASATGAQLADELRADGRDVVLAVGAHTRLPRTYRGMDILWWLERVGNFDRTIDEVGDPVAARQLPSLQLAGGRPVDLATLRAAGVRLAGRLVGVEGRRVALADDLQPTVQRADRRMEQVLASIDAQIDAAGLAVEVLEPDPPAALGPVATPDRIDLRREGITSVLWATGHRRAYPWLHVPVLDAAGELVQRRGATPWPGLYVLGQRFQHHRNSDFIDGVGRDAAMVADHLVAVGRAAPAARAC